MVPAIPPRAHHRMSERARANASLAIETDGRARRETSERGLRSRVRSVHRRGAKRA